MEPGLISALYKFSCGACEEYVYIATGLFVYRSIGHEHDVWTYTERLGPDWQRVGLFIILVSGKRKLIRHTGSNFQLSPSYGLDMPSAWHCALGLDIL